MAEVETLSPFPPNSNPYNFDLFRMGCHTTKDIQAMWGMEQNELILIYIPTGERIRIKFQPQREEEITIYDTTGIRKEFNFLASLVQSEKERRGEL